MLESYLDNVRENAPLVHNIANYVTANDVANAVLAVGASPIMSDEPEEAADITQICDGLNINIGTLHKQSIRAMKNADKLIARIFLLEGLPNLQDLGKLLIGETVAEAIACDLQAAEAQHADLVAAVKLLGEQRDFVSRTLVEELLDDVEEYIDWLETQQDLMASLGTPNYLQQAVGSGAH